MALSTLGAEAARLEPREEAPDDRIERDDAPMNLARCLQSAKQCRLPYSVDGALPALKNLP